MQLQDNSFIIPSEKIADSDGIMVINVFMMLFFSREAFDGFYDN